MEERGRAVTAPVGWYFVALAVDVQTRPAVVEWCGRSLVVWADEAGAYAADSVCPHLGTSLGLAAIEGNHLVCARHRGCVDATGTWRLDGATARRGGAPHLALLNGLIFGWLGPAAPDYPPPAPPPGVLQPDLMARVHLATETGFLIEHFVDAEHFHPVHSMIDPPITLDIAHPGVEIAHSYPRAGSDRWVTLRTHVTGPGYFHTDSPGLATVWSPVPTSSGGTDVYTFYFATNPSMVASGRFAAQMHDTAAMFDQDRQLWRRLGSGRQRSASVSSAMMAMREWFDGFERISLGASDGCTVR